MANRLADMTFSRLKTVVFSHLLLFCLFFAGVFVLPCTAREGIAPERNISVVQGDQGVPEWKLLWDKARSHVREEKYLQAASVYSEFFKQKNNIEQANWEYCKVLLKTGDYKTAIKIIATLLEKNSHRNEYILAGGQAAAQSKDWEVAARYFGRVLERDPMGELSDVALEGLVVSLRSLWKKELALPLAERLIARQPENLKLIQEMAFDANVIGQNEKARQLFKKLLEGQDVEDSVLFQAIKVFDIPGKEKERIGLLEKYIKRHPEYLPFRHNLIEYYLTNSEYEAALGHLVYLVGHLEDNDAFLLKAGDINLHKLGRPDKALIYYEKYFQKHPNDKEIKQNIANIQYILANDFLTIVENDGAWLLWRDLAKVTPNRKAIYLQMADLLEAKGMVKEHLDILLILHHHHPEDEIISMHLAQKYYDIKQYGNAFKFIDSVVQKQNRTKSYHLLRANIEIELDREIDALSSYEAALQFDAGDSELRKTSMELAGSLGNTSK
ncbi:MAG: tetratricopeptide repeat protein, partial [Proteobacteria bacterium]|nr:tetratricopeptide repeat protein [Pseudomonadota bacterium]